LYQLKIHNKRYHKRDSSANLSIEDLYFFNSALAGDDMSFYKNNTGLIILFLLMLQPLKIYSEVFEQSMFFYNTKNNSFSKKRSYLSVNIDMSSSIVHAKESFSKTGGTVPLFGKYGKLNFQKFASSSISNDIGGQSFYEKLTKTRELQTSINNLYSEKKNKAVYCGGELSSIEFLISPKLSFPEMPFYVSADIPIRIIDCKKMEICDQVSQHDDFTVFLNKNIDSVLIENNFQPLSNNYSARGFSDVTIRAGWYGQERFKKSIINSMWGDCSLGIVLPFSTMFEPAGNYLFHVPLGNSGFLGATLKYEAGIEFSQKRKNKYKIQHNSNMSFFNLFKEESINSQKGSYWSISAQIKSKFLFEGIFALFGYSYHSQEASFFSKERCNKSDEILFDQKELDKFNSETATSLNSVSINDRRHRYSYLINNNLINKDPRLKRSYAHILHASILIEPTKSIRWTDQAKLFISYNQPFLGKSSFAGIGFSGQFGFGLNIDF
jgi:hypothetical protein